LNKRRPKKPALAGFLLPPWYAFAMPKPHSSNLAKLAATAILALSGLAHADIALNPDVTQDNIQQAVYSDWQEASKDYSNAVPPAVMGACLSCAKGCRYSLDRGRTCWRAESGKSKSSI